MRREVAGIIALVIALVLFGFWPAALIAAFVWVAA